MIYDAKLTGQKFASPILDVTFELPDLYDVGSEDYDTLMSHLSKQILNLQNNGIITHSDKVEVKPLAQNATGGYDYIGFWNSADKKIHKTLLVPFNLLEASGSELATSRTLKDMFNLIIEGIRSQNVKKIKELIIEQLEFVGKDADPKNFDLIYNEIDSQQQMTQTEEFGAIMEMADRGLMKDTNEVRKYVSKFGMELEQLSPQELKVIEDQQMDADGLGLTPEEIEAIKNDYMGASNPNNKKEKETDKDNG